LATKLKNNNLKFQWKVLLVVGIILVIAANWISSRYWPVHFQAYHEQKQIFDTDFYYQRLHQISYSLYAQLLRQAGKSELELVDELVQIHDNIDEEDYRYLFEDDIAIQVPDNDFDTLIQEYVRQELQDKLNSYERIHHHDFQNLQYAAFHHETEGLLSSGTPQLEELATGSMLLNEFSDNGYHHLLVISYDEQGRLITETPMGRDYQFQDNIAMFTDSEIFDWRPIKDMTFVFALYSHDFGRTDEISTFQETQHQETFINLIRQEIIVVTLLVSILAVVIPIRTFKDIKQVLKIFNWPLEIMVVLFIVTVSIILGAMPYVAASFNHQVITIPWTSWLESFYIRFYRRGLSIGIWLILFSVLFMVLVYLKNFIFYRQKINLSKLVTEIDFRNGYTIRLFALIGINFLILNILGFVMGALFSFVIFLLARKYFTQIQSHYTRILEVTNQLACQDLDSELTADEDMDLFNSLKDALSKLQGSYKTVLEENHESQQFKEDLMKEFNSGITLISKDVELLQTEQLDSSLQQSYLIKLSQHTDHLKLRIEELLELSQLKMGTYQLNLERLNLVNSLKNVALSVQNQLGDTGVVLKTQFTGGFEKLLLDWELMEQVFENLIVNMLTHGLPGTRAYIDVMEVDDEVEIMFRNISAEEVNESAEFLLNKSDTSLSGLKLMKHYVEQHGGTLELILDGDLFKVIIRLKKVM